MLNYPNPHFLLFFVNYPTFPKGFRKKYIFTSLSHDGARRQRAAMNMEILFLTGKKLRNEPQISPLSGREMVGRRLSLRSVQHPAAHSIVVLV